MSHVTVPLADPRRSYIASAGQTVFPVPFTFFSAADILTYVGGQPVSPAAWTLNGQLVEGGFTSGTLTFREPLQPGTRVDIVRRTAPQRMSDFPYPSQTLDIRSVNTELDRMVAVQQEQRADLARGLRMDAGEGGALSPLPRKMSRANTILAFDQSGNPIPFPLPLPSFMPSPGAVDPAAHGALGDGATDSTAALQAAINAAAAYGGGRVILPAGTYLISETIELRNGVWIEGQGHDHTGVFAGAAISRLLMAPGSNCDMFRIPLYLNTAGITRVEMHGHKAANVFGCAISSARYVPEPVNNTSQDTFLTVEHCTMREFADQGADIGQAHRAVRFINCYAVENGGDGIRIAGSDSTVSKCLLGVNGGAGLRLVGAEATKVDGCDIFHNGDSQIVLQDSEFFLQIGGSLTPCVNNVFLGLSIDRGEREGFRISGQSRLTRLVGCSFNGNGLSEPGTFAHILEEATPPNTYQTTLVGCSFDDNVNVGAASTRYDIFIVNPTRSVGVAGNIHTGRWTMGVSNLPRNLRMFPGPGNSYLTGDGIGRLSSLAIGADAPLASGLWSAEDIYLTRPNRGFMSNLYFFQEEWHYAANGRGWGLIFDDLSLGVTLIHAPENTAGPGAVATVNEALRIGPGGQIVFGTGQGAGVYEGPGSPEGKIAAFPGSIYLRRDGGAGTSFYVKQSGTGDTGWVGK